MSTEAATHQKRYDDFVRTAVDTGEVWGLKSSTDNRWCVAESKGGAKRDVMPFWQDEASARRCAIDHWSKLVPAPIALDRFVEKWLTGMARDNVVVGVNWNAGLAGMVVEPSKLSEQLSQQKSGKAGESRSVSKVVAKRTTVDVR